MSNNEEIKNAVVKSVSLELTDHGILSSFVHLDFGGAGQGFGGYDLRGENASIWIQNLLRVFDVRDINNIKNKPCRVKGTNAHLSEIGHFIDDEWFNPKEEFTK